MTDYSDEPKANTKRTRRRNKVVIMKSIWCSHCNSIFVQYSDIFDTWLLKKMHWSLVEKKMHYFDDSVCEKMRNDTRAYLKFILLITFDFISKRATISHFSPETYHRALTKNAIFNSLSLWRAFFYSEDYSARSGGGTWISNERSPLNKHKHSIVGILVISYWSYAVYMAVCFVERCNFVSHVKIQNKNPIYCVLLQDYQFTENISKKIWEIN